MADWYKLWLTMSNQEHAMKAPHARGIEPEPPTIPFALERAERECPTCPSQTIFCAHFEGMMVLLTDASRGCGCGNWAYAVTSIQQGLSFACPRTGLANAHHPTGSPKTRTEFPNLPAAQAEFDRQPKY